MKKTLKAFAESEKRRLEDLALRRKLTKAETDWYFATLEKLEEIKKNEEFYNNSIWMNVDGEMTLKNENDEWILIITYSRNQEIKCDNLEDALKVLKEDSAEMIA